MSRDSNEMCDAVVASVQALEAADTAPPFLLALADMTQSLRETDDPQREVIILP